MSRLPSVAEDSLGEQSLQALQHTRVKGVLAPVYLQIANSEPALQVYLQMEAVLRESRLSLREIEALKLLVSQHNGCDYCLSVHTVKSAAAGLTSAEQLAIRRGEDLADERLQVIVQIALCLLKQPGSLSDAQLQALRQQGVDAGQLVDLSLAIATISFTNWFNHINDSEPPFGAAPPLE